MGKGKKSKKGKKPKIDIKTQPSNNHEAAGKPNKTKRSSTIIKTENGSDVEKANENKSVNGINGGSPRTTRNFRKPKIEPISDDKTDSNEVKSEAGPVPRRSLRNSNKEKNVKVEKASGSKSVNGIDEELPTAKEKLRKPKIEPISDDKKGSNEVKSEAGPIPRRSLRNANKQNNVKVEKASGSKSVNGIDEGLPTAIEIFRKPKIEPISDDKKDSNEVKSEAGPVPRRSLRNANKKNNVRVEEANGIYEGLPTAKEMFRKPKIEPISDDKKDSNELKSQAGPIPRRSLRNANKQNNVKVEKASGIKNVNGIDEGLPTTKKMLRKPKIEPISDDKTDSNEPKSQAGPIPRRSLRNANKQNNVKVERANENKSVNDINGGSPRATKNFRKTKIEPISNGAAANADQNGLHEQKITRESLRNAAKLAKINNNETANTNGTAKFDKKLINRKSMRSPHSHLRSNDEEPSTSTYGLYREGSFYKAETVQIGNITESAGKYEENPIYMKYLGRPNFQPFRYDDTVYKRQNIHEDGSVSSESLESDLDNKPLYYFDCFAQEDHGDPIYGLSFNFRFLRDKNLVFATCGSNRCTVYECPKKAGLKVASVFEVPDTSEKFFTCAWSYDITNRDPVVAVGGLKGIIHVVSVTSNKAIRVFVGHGGSINELKFHPHKPALLLSASKDHGIRLWNCSTSVLVAIFAGVHGHRDEVLSIAFDATGNRIISGGMDHAMKLWRLDKPDIKLKIALSGHFLRRDISFPTVVEHFPDYSTRDIHGHYVDCVRWFGLFVLSKSVENSIVCWQPGQLNEPGIQLNLKNSEAMFVTAFNYCDCELWFIRFDFNTFKNILATGNQNGKVYMWEFGCKHQGKAVTSVLSHPKSTSVIRQVAFSEDGSVLIYVCDDGKVWRWNRHPID